MRGSFFRFTGSTIRWGEGDWSTHAAHQAVFQASKVPPGLTTPLRGLDSLRRTHLFFGLGSCLAAIGSIPVSGTCGTTWHALLVSKMKEKDFQGEVKILLHRYVCLSKEG